MGSLMQLAADSLKIFIDKSKASLNWGAFSYRSAAINEAGNLFKHKIKFFAQIFFRKFFYFLVDFRKRRAIFGNVPTNKPQNLPHMSSLKLANRITVQKRDYIGRTEVGKETRFTVEGRENVAVTVLTMKCHGGPTTVCRLANHTPATERGGFESFGYTMLGGVSKTFRHSEVKRFTQKIADELHEKALADLQIAIDKGEFNLAGQA